MHQYTFRPVQKTVAQALLWVLLLIGLFFWGGVWAILATQSLALAVAFMGAIAVGIIIFLRPWAGLLLLLAIIPMQLLGKVTADASITIPKLLLPIVLIAWFFRKMLERDRTVLVSFFNHPVLAAGLMFMLATLPSFMNARSLAYAYGFFFFKMLPMFLVTVLVADLINTKERLKQACVAALLSAFVVGCFGIYELISGQSILAFFGQDYHLVSGSGLQLQSTKKESFSTDPAEWARVASTYGDPDFFGGYILLTFIFALGLWRLPSPKWMKALVLLYLAISTINILGTGSRAVLLALFFFAGSFIVLVRFPFRRTILILLIAGVVVLLPFIEELMPQFRHGVSFDAFYSDPRYGFWSTAKQMIEDKPLIGVGLGNFTIAYPVYMATPALHKPYMCHNIALGVLAEVGIIGLTFFAYFTATIYYSLVDTIRRSIDVTVRSLALLTLITFASFSLFALTSNTLDFEYAWIVAGLVVGLSRLARTTEPPSSVREDKNANTKTSS